MYCVVATIVEIMKENEKCSNEIKVGRRNGVSDLYHIKEQISHEGDFFEKFNRTIVSYSLVVLLLDHHITKEHFSKIFCVT